MLWRGVVAVVGRWRMVAVASICLEGDRSKPMCRICIKRLLQTVDGSCQNSQLLRPVLSCCSACLLGCGLRVVLDSR